MISKEKSIQVNTKNNKYFKVHSDRMGTHVTVGYEGGGNRDTPSRSSMMVTDEELYEIVQAINEFLTDGGRKNVRS